MTTSIEVPRGMLNPYPDDESQIPWPDEEYTSEVIEKYMYDDIEELYEEIKDKGYDVDEYISHLQFLKRRYEGGPTCAIGSTSIGEFTLDAVEMGKLNIFRDMIQKYAIEPGKEWADGQPSISIGITITGLGCTYIARYSNIKCNITNFDNW
jgi:hypothetical protein